MEVFLISLLIFTLRLIEVGVGTMRIVMLVRERAVIAAVLGVVMSLVFVFAAGIVFANLESIPRVAAFALGFGAGSLLGSWLEKKLALGSSILRIVTPVGAPPIEDILRAEGYGVTVLNAQGLRGDVKLSWTVVPRKKVRHVINQVESATEEAYVTVQSVTPIERPDRENRVRP